jgi:polysaccharide export outer membrane protein
MKKIYVSLVVPALFSCFLWQCARYPAIPEMKGDRPTINQETIEEQQAAARMREVLVSLKQEKPKDYVIGIKDILKIDVWEQPELTRTTEVSQDGTINLPIIGTVVASGKSMAVLEREITERLAGRYLINPQVTLQVVEYKSKYVSVLGEVGGKGGKGVGKYPLRERTTLLEILTEAGFSDDAGSECVVIRPTRNISPVGEAGKRSKTGGETIHIDIPELMKGDQLQNIEIQDGDTIYIPKAQHYYVIGEVEKPGEYKFQKGITVLKAIATAEGLTEKAASLKRVKILREENDQKRRISVNPTDLVKPEDTLIVPASFF